jgi:hypothetical protein
MGTPDITSKITATVISLNGPHEVDKITAPFAQTISKIESAYAELSSISRYRNTYNSTWAFSYAFSRMHALANQLFSLEVSEKIAVYAGSFKNRSRKQDILKKYEKITDNLSDLIRKTGTSQKLYRTTIWLISLAEGVISLIIVMLITEFAAVFNRAVSLPQLSLLFLGVFGSLRLILERLKTRFLRNWRWTRYQDSVDQAFGSIAAAAGISCILAHHIRQGTFLEQIDDLLEVGLSLLHEKPTPEERRSRRAAHRSARLLAEQRERLEKLQGPQPHQSHSQMQLIIPGAPPAENETSLDASSPGKARSSGKARFPGKAGRISTGLIKTLRIKRPEK